MPTTAPANDTPEVSLIGLDVVTYEDGTKRMLHEPDAFLNYVLGTVNGSNYLYIGHLNSDAPSPTGWAHFTEAGHGRVAVYHRWWNPSGGPGVTELKFQPSTGSKESLARAISESFDPRHFVCSID